MKIYVVTDGNYSDYHICGVATTEETANKLKDYVNRNEFSDARIETYETDAWEDILNVGGFYEVVRRDDGSLYVHREEYDIEECYKKRNHVKRSKWRNIYTYLVARDEDHAKKIASDLFAKYKAEKEGL